MHHFEDQVAKAQREEHLEDIVPPKELLNTASKFNTSADFRPPAEAVLLSFFKRYMPAFAQAERVRRIVSTYRRRGQRQVPPLTVRQSDEAVLLVLGHHRRVLGALRIFAALVVASG